jgi:hypothetical protein
MFAGAIVTGQGKRVGGYLTTNGGTKWIANQNLPGTIGDPGPWIWGVPAYSGRLGMSSTVNGAGIYTIYSDSNFNFWSNPQKISAGNDFGDKNFSISDDVPSSPYYGRAYTVWRATGGANMNRVVISYTDDGGDTWSEPSLVSPPLNNAYMHHGADIKIGDNGDVYVVWATYLYDFQSTWYENYLGFAKSTDGGVTWTVSEDEAVDINGISTRTLYSYFGHPVTANGMPRLDIDRTNGARNGWIYVVTSEQYNNPARDMADIVLNRSTDGGATWSRVRVNQDPAGKANFIAAVNVDEDGGVNVIYYDQRNYNHGSTTTEVYLSRSINGGNTWTDTKISDWMFTYAGDQSNHYMGITSGNGRLWPAWADNRMDENEIERYQAWTTEVLYKEDLWSKDLPNDVGKEANPDSLPMWTSPDIWVRNQNDGRINQVHQNPKYIDSVTPNYVYVRVRNRGASPGSGVLKVYWSKASTSFLWPTNWNNYRVNGVLFGDIIPISRQINNLAPNAEVILEFPWVPPNPALYAQFGADSSHFCLLSRIETSPVSPFGMTFPEVSSLYWNIRNNNNIVLKNVTIIRDYGITCRDRREWLTVRNVRTTPTNNKFSFYTPPEQRQTPFFQYGNIEVNIGPQLYGRWMAGGGQGYGVQVAPEPYTLKITHPEAFIKNIVIQPEEQFNINVRFCLNAQPPPSIEKFNFHIMQYLLKEGEEELDNGEDFEYYYDHLQLRPIEVKDYNVDAYPNPFNPSVEIRYSIPAQGNVKLTIYDILGKEIAVLVNEIKQEGVYTLTFNGSSLPSGTYFYRFESGSYTVVNKLVLLK